METLTGRVNDGLHSTYPHSLGILVEWKLRKHALFDKGFHVSPLAGDPS